MFFCVVMCKDAAGLIINLIMFINRLQTYVDLKAYMYFN